MKHAFCFIMFHLIIETLQVFHQWYIKKENNYFLASLMVALTAVKV